MKNDTCAIIITYNPSIDLFSKLILSLSKQCNIIIIDNHSAGESKKNIINLSNEHSCIFLPLSHNFGIAKAQNEGIRYVEKKMRHVKYLIFFDQDSIPDHDLIGVLYDEYHKLNINNNIAVIGPSLYDPRSNSFHGFHLLKNIRYFRVSPEKMQTDTIECFYINSSGSFCSVDVFKDVGYYNEDFFIDLVETEWCLRAKHMGFVFFGTKRTKITHHMGDDVLEYSFFGKKIIQPYRNSLRHNYLFRNSISLLKMKYVPVVWKFYCLVKLTYTFILFGFFTKEKKLQRQAMINGIRDGVSGQKGRIDK